MNPDEMAPVNGSIPTSVKLARAAVWLSYGSLLGLFTVDGIMTWLAGAPPVVALVLWLVRVLPLLIFLPGLLSQSPRVAAWLCFAILLYFIHAVTTAFIPGEAVYGTIYSLLCSAVFVSLIAWIRVMRRHYHISLQRPG